MSFSFCIILYLLTGAIAGLLAGLLGIGGGAVVVPTLAFIFLQNGMPNELIMHLAIGTSLTAMFFTSFFSSYSHNKKGRVEWDILFKTAPGICLGVFIGAFFSARMNTDTLTVVFAIYLIFISIQMLLKKDKVTDRKTLFNDSRTTLVGGGVIIGLLSGLLGVGGGTLTVPFLNYLGRSMHKAIGTSAACGFIITIIGTICFTFLSGEAKDLPEGSIGYIYLPAALGVTLMSSIFAPIGAKISGQLSPKVLIKCFSLLLLAVAVKMLV